MKASECRYRRITPEAKRDWHKLLLYNEHGCRGMRAVMTLAAHELELWAAYQKTHFVVLDDGREITASNRCVSSSSPLDITRCLVKVAIRLVSGQPRPACWS